MYREKLPGWLKHLDFMLLDIVALLLAFFLAFYIRIGVADMLAWYRNLLGVMMLIQIVLALCTQPYKDVLRRGYYLEFVCSLRHVVLLLLLTALYLFFAKIADDTSRLLIGYTAVFCLIFTYGFRLAWKWAVKKSRVSFNRRSLMVVTVPALVKEVLHNISGETNLSYQVTAIALPEGEEATRLQGIPMISGRKATMDFLRSHWVDEVLTVLPEDYPVDDALQKEISGMGVTVHLVLADRLEHKGRKQVVEKFGDYTVMTSSVNVVSPLQMFLKRLMDVVGGLIGCIFTCILILVIGPMIYIKSPGPIFFAQERVGRNGKKFKMYKFRSMYTDAEKRKKDLMAENRVKDGMMFKLDWDPRIIGSKTLPDGTHKKGIGNFIRDTSLDEFPQFFNVLKGDMSLVGTRPPTVDEWEKYELHHHARLVTKPGITGMWQVSGRSEITDFEEVVRLDMDYIMNWDLGLDIKILLKTVGVVFRREGSM